MSALVSLAAIPKVPRTSGQRRYISSLRSAKPITLVTGPAGTGKTLFACQEAVSRFHQSDIDRIVITRPTVTVDESLGFLPGGVDEKMEPWMEPIYAILCDHFTHAQMQRMKERRVLEILPLGYARGRTFERCMVLADEFQNATVNQTRSLLTRMGPGSRMVVMGDVEQIDLESGESGLVDLIKRLEGRPALEYVECVAMGSEDVQRHPAVAEILGLYTA